MGQSNHSTLEYIDSVYKMCNEITSLWWTKVIVGGTCENNDLLKGLIEERTRGDVCTQFLFFPTAVPEIEFVKLNATC